MKKHLFCLLFLGCALFSGKAIAQSSGVLTTINAVGNINMIRFDPITGNYIAASPHSGGVVYFIRTDMTTFTEVKLVTNSTIMDFEIIDRLVFFCGEDLTNNSGFLGWFNIDSLFDYGADAHIEYNLVKGKLLTLENIEVYKKPENIYCIAGYGRDRNLDYTAFEATGDPISGMTYRTLLMEYDNYKTPIIDMAVTDNYVVYMSQERKTYCDPYFGWGVTLYPFPKYNMFSLPLYPGFFFQTATINNCGSRLYPENIEPAHNSTPKMTYPKGDNIAICAHRRDNDFISCSLGEDIDTCSATCACDMNFTNSYLTLRFYDLSPLAINKPIVMTSANAAKLYPKATSVIREIKYDSRTKNYLVLHSHETSPSVLEYALTTFDYSTGTLTNIESEYQTVYNTSNVWTPFDLCIDNASNYTVSGFKNLSTNYFFWQEYIGGGNGDCAYRIPNPLIPLNTEPHKKVFNPYLPIPWLNISFQLVGTEILQNNNCEIICQ